MLEKFKRKHENFITTFYFFLKNNFYSNLAPVAIHSRISAGELIIIGFIIVLTSFMAAYLLGLLLAKISVLLSKKKPQEKIHIRAFHISIICLLAHNVISFIVNIYDASFLVSIITTPFLILFLLMWFLKKHNSRDKTFEDFLKKNNMKK